MVDGNDKPKAPSQRTTVSESQKQVDGIRWSQYEQRMLRVENIVHDVKKDLQQIERDAANLQRGKITTLLERQRYLEAVTEQLVRRHDDYRSGLEMLQRKSENQRSDTVETERRLLERIELDAKDKRGLTISLITAILGALGSIIYAISQG